MTPQAMQSSETILRDACAYAAMAVIASGLAEAYSIFVVSYRLLHFHVMQDVAEVAALGWRECGVQLVSCCAGEVGVGSLVMQVCGMLSPCHDNWSRGESCVGKPRSDVVRSRDTWVRVDSRSLEEPIAWAAS